MSYEGHIQYLCPVGHYWMSDEGYEFGDVPEACPDCNKIAAWENSVDDTNGEAEGHVDVILVTPAVKKRCDMGHFHVIEAATYKVPDR